MTEKKLIGRRIQELRKGRRLSQEKIAEKADISATYLSRIECGRENPTLDMLIKLSYALDVEIWEMFDFGHDLSKKELKDGLQKIIKIADEQTLHLLLKFIRTLTR